MNILIRKNSVIYETAENCLQRLNELNDLAGAEIVTIEFFGVKMITTGRHRKIVNVAKKYIGAPDKLCGMIESKILGAWK